MNLSKKLGQALLAIAACAVVLALGWSAGGDSAPQPGPNPVQAADAAHSRR